MQFGSAGNRSSLWTYNTAISKTLSSLQFHSLHSQTIVSFSCTLPFSKIKYTNSPGHFIYSRIQRERIHHPLPMHHSSLPNFQNVIRISIDFNECTNICGHIHTQCTLALISSLSHFMTGSWPWGVGI